MVLLSDRDFMISKLIKFIIGVLLLLVLCVVCVFVLIKRPSFVFSVEDESQKYVNVESLELVTKELSQNFLPRNYYNSDNLDLAAHYIKAKLSEFNSDTYLQTYDVKDKSYSNVIANYGPDTDDIVIVGAHYDAFSTLPGADDNASGVAGLLELGRLLSKVELTKRIILVAYTLEESWDIESMGSVRHAKSLGDKNVELMISLEMIGYFSEEEKSQSFPLPFLKYLYPEKGNYIVVVGEVTSNKATGVKNAINKYTDLEAFSINAPRSIKGIDLSDHRSYWDLDYPAVMVTDSSFYRNKNYHRTMDTYEKLNYESMSRVVYGVYKHVIDI